MDTFTTTSITETTNWFERMKNSIGSVCIGITLFLASFVILFWNEGRAVKRQRDLDEAIGIYVDIDDIMDPLLFGPNYKDILSKYDGKLVYTNGMTRLKTGSTILYDDLFQLNATKDGANGETFVSKIDNIEYKLDIFQYQRVVETYQWMEETSTTSRTEKTANGGTRTVSETTYNYKKVWRAGSDIMNSANFKYPNDHINPTRPLLNELFLTVDYTKDITLDLLYELDVDITSQLSWFTSWKDIPFNDDNTNDYSDGSSSNSSNSSSTTTSTSTSTSTSTTTSTSNGIIQENLRNSVDPTLLQNRQIDISSSMGMIYIGNSTTTTNNNPSIGDTRITFETVIGDEISVVALLKDGKLQSYKTKNGGRNLLLFERGIPVGGAEQMFETAYTNNTITTWILRGVGWLCMFIGISSIFLPLVVFVDIIIPCCVGDLLELGLEKFVIPTVGCCISCPCTLLIISIGWIFYRPIFAIISIVILGITTYLIYMLMNNNRKKLNDGQSGGDGGNNNNNNTNYDDGGGGVKPNNNDNDDVEIAVNPGASYGGNTTTPYVTTTKGNNNNNDDRPSPPIKIMGDFANALDN